MTGFVPTPAPVVDLMVEKLFQVRRPGADSLILDPGCGQGVFMEGILRWCSRYDNPIPTIVGIESDPGHAEVARDRFAAVRQVQIRPTDFLREKGGSFDYIIGNPPYVSITGLTAKERAFYRGRFATATGRFDLYLLFFEQAVRFLRPSGRLVFITPEKFLYVATARPLRRLLGRLGVEELHFLDEQTFGELVTYPLVSTITSSAHSQETRVVLRDGSVGGARLAGIEDSWLPPLRGVGVGPSTFTLQALCTRISCGVATGADPIFVVKDSDLDVRLAPFTHPTISGRQLVCDLPPAPSARMLVPYSIDGHLLPEEELGALGTYLSAPARHDRLVARTCVARKPWYAFHETPPLRDMLRPKLLCKDITSTPFFVPDYSGRIVPRHSVYYVVPANPRHLDSLLQYLNSPLARTWLHDHCQRAAKGFLRLQSHVLKQLPIPSDLAQAAFPADGQHSLLEALPA